MEVLDSIWGGALLGLVSICIGAYVTYRFSRRQLIDDRKRDSLIQVARCASSYHANETDSLTNLYHSMNEVMVRFSSDKLREVIYDFLSSDGYTVNETLIDRILDLMCEDLGEDIEWIFKSNRP